MKKILLAINLDCISMNAEETSNRMHNRGGEDSEEE